ncbi:MAG: hypothetical protein AAFU03_12905, partial [Bacteroidota bacterium]
MRILFLVFFSLLLPLVNISSIQGQDCYSNGTREIVEAFSFTTIKALPGHLQRQNFKQACQEATSGIDGFKARYMLGRWYAAQ